MFGALRRLVLYRILGARIMLGLAILGWLRSALGRWQASRTRVVAEERQARRETSGPPAGEGSAYQPSQGESQIVHREPR